MASLLTSLGDLVASARSGGVPPGEVWPPGMVAVDLDIPVVDAPALPWWWPAVVVGVAPSPSEVADHATCDVVVGADGEDLAAIEATVASNPLASTSLTTLLRGAGARASSDGLLLESAVYSSLQAGPEFAAWRAARPAKERPRAGERVRVERDGHVLHITLTRPEVRNALDTLMRDQLVEAFALARLDDTITEIHLRGDGPSFCAGGDLDEFGARPDPATAHIVRILQSAGRSIEAVSTRVTAHVHGACRGSGVELPAFAGRVVARSDATFGLPEVQLGLIPGAGGTVSLPRRIGRHRTAWLALTGRSVDAPTALAWGLVDDVRG